MNKKRREVKMMEETEFKAKKLFESGEVVLIDSGLRFHHFKVKQNSCADYANVYFAWNAKTMSMQWSCDAVSENKKTGRKYGCIFFKGDQSKPFCSHTLAAEFFLKHKGVIKNE